MSQVLTQRQLQKRLRMDEKRHKLSEDAVKKITTAAAKLKLHTKRKDKVHVEKKDKPQPEKAFVREEEAGEKQPVDTTTTETGKPAHQHHVVQPKSAVAPCSKGIPQQVLTATRVTERRWTLSELLQNFGVYVQKHCTHLPTIPSASEIVMWVRCADRALQLNGWTINSFLLESHVVFTYMLVSMAFQRFSLRTLADVKEIVLMCLYVSYTYNANEISYPLRPFLVKQDRAAFWDKCTTLSLDASSYMLSLNQDRTYYLDVLASLKRVTSL